MSIAPDLLRPIDYSDHERAKWKTWIAADPERLALPFQAPTGRFPTVGSLLDHLFLVERRHLSRLEGAVPPEMTGVSTGDWQGLFDFCELVRADFRRFAEDLDDAEGAVVLTFTVPSGPLADPPQAGHQHPAARDSPPRPARVAARLAGSTAGTPTTTSTLRVCSVPAAFCLYGNR